MAFDKSTLVSILLTIIILISTNLKNWNKHQYEILNKTWRIEVLNIKNVRGEEAGLSA